MTRLGVLGDMDRLRFVYAKTRDEENSYIDPAIIEESIKEHRFLVSGSPIVGFCDFRKRVRDGTVVIYNIFVLVGHRGKGHGKRMVEWLQGLGCRILVKCPRGISSNKFYERMGFQCVDVLLPLGRRKKALNVWVWEGEGCGNGCGYVKPYGFVPEAGCVVHYRMGEEELARLFHSLYESLAPQFGYETRKESAVPWEEVPEKNRQLMVEVCRRVLDELYG